MVRDGGVIARGYDAELDELRDISENCGQFLIDLETRERARTGIGNLRVEYNKVHGFYIEVTRGQTDKVPDDYRRRQTLKNAERYITPELKTFEDKALVRAGTRARTRTLALRRVAAGTAAFHRGLPAGRRGARGTGSAGGVRRAGSRARLGRALVLGECAASKSNRDGIRSSRRRSSSSSPTTAR